jgi:epoxyqueuosine reductase
MIYLRKRSKIRATIFHKPIPKMSPVELARNTEWLKEEARQLGFLHCGIAPAEFLEDEAPLLEKWLGQGSHGQMQWMENHFDKRLDPGLLVEGAKSVISLAYNYYPEKQIFDTKSPYRISKYAYGKDYHKVVKKKMLLLLQRMQEKWGNFAARAFVDSAPVMDKAWAKRAGVGWQGKHSNIINKKTGSFFFLGEIIVDLTFDYDAPLRDYCGNCRLCIDACPTDAITPYSVDGSKCISYFTIELKEKIPSEMMGKFENWIFGCDVCQDVCPWNKRSVPHQEPKFAPSPELEKLSKSDWEEISQEAFEQLFQGSAIKRTKWEGLKRNIEFVSLQSEQ